MDKIDHFLHRHPLVLKKEAEAEEIINVKVVCSGCHNSLEDPFYGCSNCKFYLHKSCAEHPEENENFSHPCSLSLHILSISYSCGVCSRRGVGFGYRCRSCEFNVHVECAQRSTIGEEVICHFTHQHPLTIVDQKKDSKVRCFICEKLCSDSSDSSAYGCQGCNFFLHTSCMNIPRKIEDHFFHPSCPLKVDHSASYKCKGCDKFYRSGLAFRCGKCRFYLDVKCALLPTVESKGADKIQHYAHGHPLAFLESKEFGKEVQCRACGENCSGPCFGCERCDFFLHRQCAVESPPKTVHHPFHPPHPLTLTKDRDRSDFKCQACGGKDGQFLQTYRCVKCGFNLHTVCAMPKLNTLLLKYEGHPHFLLFFHKSRGPFSCEICRSYARNCFFRCVACDFNIHLCCFPSSKKTLEPPKYHLHPLTLTQSPLEFEMNISGDIFNSNDEFYCDVCEKRRYKFEPVYHCEKCNFIVGLCCAKSELLRSLSTSKGQSSRAISNEEENSAIEADNARIEREIAALTEKQKPLEAEIQKHRAKLKPLEKEIEPIKKKLEQLKRDLFLSNYHLNHNRKEN